MLSDLSHPNIVSFVGVHYGRDKNDISLIMERLHTDLAAFVYSQPKTSETQRIHILWDVSKGLEYLHSLVPPLLHRDLTAPNVLLTEDLTAKIGDLGVSRYIDPDAGTQILSKTPGNNYYMPPEARAEKPVYTVKLDIFSFGTLIMHTFIGKVPELHDVPHDERAIQLSREGKIELTRRRKAVDQMGEDHCMYPIIVRCLHDNPDPRPIASEVCELVRELCLKYPTVGFQKMEIKTALTQPLREGDTWFLVSMCWMKKWKEYVNWDESSTDEDSANPGPVDNTPLLIEGSLRERLGEKTDYCLLPESAWNELSSWYGLSTGSKVIARKVVQCGDGLMVEVYLLELEICVYPNMKDVKRRTISKADTVVDLERVMREELEVSSSVECRVWHRYKTHTYELLSRSDQTLQDAGLIERQDTIIVLEKNTDGIWPQETSPSAQKIEIESDLGQMLKKGDIWYVVGSWWWRRWRNYVGLIPADSEESAHPGPVDNAKLLLNGNKLRERMLEKLDYYLLPESAWEKVCFWYGLSPGSKVIPRTVIGCGPHTNECEVEVYPLEINLCVSSNQSAVKKREFSRANSVATIVTAAREDFEIECEFHSQNDVELLSNPDQTLLEAGLHSGQTVVFRDIAIDDQKREIQDCLRQQFKKGDIWYLVDICWMKQWKKYVGYDAWDQASAGKKYAHPGPLDNSTLFRDERFCAHLMDELDYCVVPESAWNKLSSWYGLSTGSRVISRKVIECGLNKKYCKVEVYLLEFKLCVFPHLNDVKKRKFSRAASVANIERVIREEFEIPSSSECRVWCYYMTNTYKLLSRSDQTLQDARLYNGQTIVIEQRNEDGSWSQTTFTSTSLSSDFSSCTFTQFIGGGNDRRSRHSQQPSQSGLCELKNVENTCFMNSALQCLSNTVPLTEYFLGTEAGYRLYRKHINKDNPLEMGGAIAEAYGALMEEIWEGNVSVTTPRDFKIKVYHHAPQFVDAAQHDSQKLQLLVFLLDALHKDLNVIRKQPEVDMTNETEDRSELEVAEEAWYKHLQCNLSVIVKLFQGQLRSTLVCPKCNQVSKTFDHFTLLSLPIPFKETCFIFVYLIRTDPMAPIVKYKLQLPKEGRVGDLKGELGRLAGVRDTHLAVVDVYDSLIKRIYSNSDSLSQIMDKDDIYCYELAADSEGSKRKMVHVPVYMRVKSDRPRYYRLFGLPTVAYVPAKCTYRTLYTAIVSRMRRYVKILSEVEGATSTASRKEWDLFRLVVVDSSGSREIKKLVDDLKKPLQLTDSTYIACDWDMEVQEKCYNEEATKEDRSCRDEGVDKIQLMDCFEQFIVFRKDEEWNCPHCKEHVEASKKLDLWKLPDIFVVYLERFSCNRSARDKLVDFPVNGLDLSSLVCCPDSPEAVYDLYAVINHSGGTGGDHYTAYAKNKETNKWYDFDDSHVSEISEDRLVSAAAYVLFYRHRGI